jgi:hypothetical protein
MEGKCDFMNKQFKTADKGWYSGLKKEGGKNNSSPQKTSVSKLLCRASDLESISDCL